MTIYNTIIIPDDNLFLKPQDSDEWKLFKSQYEEIRKPLTTEVNDEETVMKSYHKFLQMLAYIHQTHFRATEKAKIKEKVTSFSKNIFKGMKKENRTNTFKRDITTPQKVA